MKVGDLVRHDQGFIGVITCIDPEEIGCNDEVEVVWTDGFVGNISVRHLGVINEDR